MSNLAYFRSERFIHDGLAELAGTIAEKTREEWKKTRTLAPYALTWPSDTLKADDGGSIERAVICRFPEDFTSEQRMAALRRMVERTKAYGLVLIERHQNALKNLDDIWVLFETHHGARAWRMRLERHGDITVCCAPEVREDAEYVGILWRPKRGVS